MFVCNSCLNRAPTMRDLVNKDCGAGLLCIAKGTRPYYANDAITDEDIAATDLVVAMTAKEALEILDKYPDLKKNNKLLILGLGDDYDYMDVVIKATYSLFYKDLFANIYKNAMVEENAKW